MLKQFYKIFYSQKSITALWSHIINFTGFCDITPFSFLFIYFCWIRQLFSSCFPEFLEGFLDVFNTLELLTKADLLGRKQRIVWRWQIRRMCRMQKKKKYPSAECLYSKLFKPFLTHDCTELITRMSAIAFLLQCIYRD